MNDSAKMPKPFSGFYGSGQGLDAAYVNPQGVRLVHSGDRDVFGKEEVNRRSGARAARVGRDPGDTGYGPGR